MIVLQSILYPNASKGLVGLELAIDFEAAASYLLPLQHPPPIL